MKSVSDIVTLAIKNMVCDRCIKVVRQELTNLGLDVRRVDLGEAEVASGSNPVDISGIRGMLELNGFELIEDRRKKTIEAVKVAIVKLIHQWHGERPRGWKLSSAIAAEVGQEYDSLSTLFSSVEGMTIEQYSILQRIERAKELLKYAELTLSEIAWQLGYSSPQHLSSQFHAVTGMTPSRFREIGRGRTPLDKIAAKKAFPRRKPIRKS